LEIVIGEKKLVYDCFPMFFIYDNGRENVKKYDYLMDGSNIEKEEVDVFVERFLAKIN